MTTKRGVGHLRVTALGLALLVWPASLTCAGDAPEGDAGKISVSLRTFESPRFVRKPTNAQRRTWSPEEARRTPNPFLSQHLLPRLRTKINGLGKLNRVPEAERLGLFRRDIERATQSAVRDYLEEIAIDPMRDRLEEFVDLKLKPRFRRSKRPEPRVDPLPFGSEPPGPGAAASPTRTRERKGDFDVDVGISSGMPEVNLEYKRGRLDLELELGVHGPELQLNLGSGKRRLRLDIRATGRMGLVFRSSRLKNHAIVRATLDPASGNCVATYVHKF
jgi:hypothetical protein